MKKINVLHLIYSLQTGGAEKVIENYAKFHDRTFFNPIACALTDGGHIVEEIKKGGVKVFLLNKKGPFDLKIILKIIKLIKSNNINIIHLHNFSANFWGTIAAILCRVPVMIRTEHNVVIKKKFFDYFVFKINSFFDLFQKKIICVSNQVKASHIEKFAIKPHKYITIYNGIDLKPFESKADINEYLKAFSLDSSYKRVMSIGSLTPQKGHEYLLKAAQIILAKNKKVIFFIIGDGPRKKELIDMAEKMGVKNNIIFTGVRADISSLLQLADVFVLSSLWEGFPITILEAMAAGKPIVATNVGGNSEAVINGETGFIVQAKDEEAIADNILLLLDDDKLRKTMGLKGRERFEAEFKAEKMVKRTEDVYKSFLEKL